MSAVQFEPWPKIPRLNREIIITEKINGTNAAVLIVPAQQVDRIITRGGPDGEGGVKILETRLFDPDASKLVGEVHNGAGHFYVFAQSRTRFITPAQDNFGFARWVQDHQHGLVETLGEGRHFGEWWGSGIQGSYGAPKEERYFSLFNTSRWTLIDPWERGNTGVPGLRRVPLLYKGPFSGYAIQNALGDLEKNGSYASEGFKDPEGIVVFHTASNSSFKVTLKGDEAPKGPEAHRNDEEQR